MKFTFRFSDEDAERIQKITSESQARVAKVMRDALNEVARSFPVLHGPVNCRCVVDLPKETFAPGYWPKGHAIRM